VLVQKAASPKLAISTYSRSEHENNQAVPVKLQFTAESKALEENGGMTAGMQHNIPQYGSCTVTDSEPRQQQPAGMLAALPVLTTAIHQGHVWLPKGQLAKSNHHMCMQVCQANPCRHHGCFNVYPKQRSSHALHKRPYQVDRQ